MNADRGINSAVTCPILSGNDRPNSSVVDSGPQAAVVCVSDNGMGIPEPEQERLFERFFRSTTASSERIPGTGLGLAITRAIVEGHGGTISVESAEGEGTSVTVTLPREAGYQTRQD